MSSAQIYARKSDKQREHRTYEMRRNRVSATNGYISSLSSPYLSRINTTIDDLSSALLKAVKGIYRAGLLSDRISEMKEDNCSNDYHLSTYSDNLSSEVSDCNQKLAELEDQISTLNSQYWTAVYDEEQEAARRRSQ